MPQRPASAEPHPGMPQTQSRPCPSQSYRGDPANCTFPSHTQLRPACSWEKAHLRALLPARFPGSANTARRREPTMTAVGYGLPVEHLLIGIGAALHYDNAADQQSVELQAKIKENGVRAAFSEISGVTDAAILDKVVEKYDNMKAYL